VGGKRGGGITSISHLFRLNIHHIPGSPNALHAFNFEILINLYIAPGAEETLGQVLGIGNHAHGGEIQIRGHLLSGGKGEFGGFSIGEFVVDFRAVDDLDAQGFDLRFGVFNHGRGETGEDGFTVGNLDSVSMRIK
jgi:hypothetical protein